MKRHTSGSASSGLLKDLAKALLAGFIFGAALALFFFLVGFLLRDRQLVSALDFTRSGLFFCVAAALFILAGMLLIKGKKPERFPQDNGWYNHFHILGPKAVIGLITISFILLASVIDYLHLLLSGSL